MNINKASRTWLAAFAVVAVSTACSSGSGSDSTDDPIRVMTVGPQQPTAAFGGIAFPYGANGVRAAAEAINAAGGIDGRSIRVDVCDTKGDPNLSAQCGRSAASNKDIAVLGTFDPIGAPQLLTVLQAAGIPYLGGLPTTTAEFTSAVSFQFDPGPILGGTALTKLWKDSGCTTVASILPANPGNDKLAELGKKQGEQLGLNVHTQLIKPGTPDVTPSLSVALSAKPDCFTYSGDGQTNVKYILGVRKLGFTGKIITTSGSLTPQFLKPLGAAADGILILNSTLQPTSTDPMVVQFNKDMNAFFKGDAKQVAINSNEFGQDGWSSVQLLKQALTGANDVSAKALLSKIPTMCDVNVGNVYPHVNFCKPVTTSTIVPRLYNNHWQYFKVEGGQYVPTDNAWHDMADAVPGR